MATNDKTFKFLVSSVKNVLIKFDDDLPRYCYEKRTYHKITLPLSFSGKPHHFSLNVGHRKSPFMPLPYVLKTKSLWCGGASS